MNLKLRLGLSTLALVMCQCAAVNPLVFLPPRTETLKYEVAHQAATTLVEKYQHRINGTSTWLVGHHIAEALIGGGATSALVGQTTEDTTRAVKFGSGVALLGLVFQVAVDKNDLERQQKTYMHGVAALECAIAVTGPTNGNDDAEQARALFDAIHAVQSAVAAELGLDPGQSQEARKPKNPAVPCMTRLFPTAAPALR